jgi:hypothetical protein
VSASANSNLNAGEAAMPKSLQRHQGHSMYAVIEKLKSIEEAVKKFGRL